MDSLKKWEAILHVTLVNSVKAHQQPIICLKCEGGRVISASQDHSLKVRCFDLFITEKKTSQNYRNKYMYYHTGHYLHVKVIS